MVCREFPDNSVFCHARRLAQLPQDVFITGAVLGVNCSDLPLPFFADIYNEDWFFFAEAVAYRRLTKVGDAQQAEYDPYAEPTRASHEEFGDLIAEGLYEAVIQGLCTQTDLRRSKGFFHAIGKLATEKYWETFIDVRRRGLAETQSELEGFTSQGNCSDQVLAVLKRVAGGGGQEVPRIINRSDHPEALRRFSRGAATRHRPVEQNLPAHQ